MAEVGLLAFARTAWEVGRAVLPPYRTRFSKHQFTQPQLLAVLCLMRYEDWTFREAEVRLKEHRELCQTLGLKSVPDYTTLYRFLKRLDGQAIDRAVGETVRRMGGGRGCTGRGACVAVDATGLAQGAVSTYFVRRLHHHGQSALPWRHWLKWLVVADLNQQPLLSQRARRGRWNDCGSLPAVMKTASRQTPIGWVLADAEFDSKRNHTYIRQRLGAQSVIPAKRGKKGWRVRGVRAEMRRAFLRKPYRRRALIETLFSSVKRKLSARAPGRSLRMQMRQAPLLGLSFNLYRLRHRYGEAAVAHLTVAFLNSFEVCIQTLGFWVSEAPKSAFPDAVWIDFSLRTESLAVWDASYKDLENQLVHPDAAIIKRIIEEKDAAVTLASDAVKAVESSKVVVSAADYAQLHRQFLLQLYVARAYRLYAELYFRFRMWDQSGRGKVPPEITALRTSLRSLTAEMEAQFASSPVFCPRSLQVSLDRLDAFLQGKAFPRHAASLVQSHPIAYPPVNWGVCTTGRGAND